MTNAFSVGALLGLIIGFILGVVGASGVFDDAIKAGVFQSNGVAYKIERVTP